MQNQQHHKANVDRPKTLKGRRQIIRWKVEKLGHGTVAKDTGYSVDRLSMSCSNHQTPSVWQIATDWYHYHGFPCISFSFGKRKKIYYFLHNMWQYCGMTNTKRPRYCYESGRGTYDLVSRAGCCPMICLISSRVFGGDQTTSEKVPLGNCEKSGLRSCRVILVPAVWNGVLFSSLKCTKSHVQSQKCWCYSPKR